MNTHEAFDYLKRYQKWRRGEDERTMEEAGLDPKTIGEAIDIAIQLHDKIYGHRSSN